MKYKVESTGTPTRTLGGSSPRECLERSGAVFGRMLRPGDTISGERIVEKLRDPDDDEVVFVLDSGSHVSVESPFG